MELVLIVVGLGAVAISTLVIFGYLLFIWWLDRYEREPLWLVMLTFVWGALGGTALGCMISLFLSVPMTMLVPAVYSELALTVGIAPLAEEFTKGLIFVLLILTPHLDNETDGLIYGAAAGLGFAAVENVLYFLAFAAAGPEVFFATVVMRTLFTSLVHAISTALLGYTVGYVRHRQLKPWLWALPILGFVLAVVNHAFWNLMAVVSGSQFLSDAMSAGALGIGMLFVVLMGATMFAITQFSLMREHKIIRRYLRDEAQQGTLPKEHAEIIPSWRKRRKKGWLSPHIPHEEYVEAATLLAFRRYQTDTVAPRYRDSYNEGVEEYRQKVRQLNNQTARGQTG